MRQAGSSGYCGVWPVFVIPECPSPRKAHPRRESNEESPGRPQCGFRILPQRTPRGKHGKADMFTQKRSCAAPPTPFSAFPRLFVPCRDRHKETHKPEVNQPSPITAPTIRERATGDHDPRRNRNGTYRKPSCLALMRQTAGVIERKTFRENRITGVNRTQSPESATACTRFE